MSEENATYKGSVILKATNSIKVKANYQEKPSTLQVSGVPIWIFKKADKVDIHPKNSKIYIQLYDLL
ncbi:hypothetical protein T4D_1841 [Trichinella pseudospiralis]|uniref:Uncharacterized protein n=1 Tax=Trichinella pseudospiralis TaxID=6337 RepID=A0A0V1G1E0_TRIPS|nr:hypothetical protein T4D_1841 [Trichinella pseudospiralis]